MPIQHYNNIDKTNEQNEQDEWININEIEDFLEVLWNESHNINNILVKLKSIIIKKKHWFLSKLEIKANIIKYLLN